MSMHFSVASSSLHTRVKSAVFFLPIYFQVISFLSSHLSTFSPLIGLPSPSSVLSGPAYLFVIDPCPGCPGIDWLSLCHRSSLSILTKFDHPVFSGHSGREKNQKTKRKRMEGEAKHIERWRRRNDDGATYS